MRAVGSDQPSAISNPLSTTSDSLTFAPSPIPNQQIPNPRSSSPRPGTDQQGWTTEAEPEVRASNISPRPLAGEGPGVRADDTSQHSPSAPMPNPISAPPFVDDPGDQPVDGNVLKTIQIILSGVARVQARFACGRNLIAQMLCGSNSAKITKLQLHKLSTHGLLKHLKQEEVLLLIEALIIEGCLRQVEQNQFRPVVELTDYGIEVMKGKTSFDRPLPVPAELLWKLQGERHREESHKGQGEKLAKTLYPSHYWTLRLLAAGFTVDECAAIRGLDRQVIIEHAKRGEQDPQE